MKNMNETIGTNLMSLRKKYHMTQEEVAEVIGVSRQAIAKWEKGESTPDLDHCMALAELFEVSLDSLVSNSHRGIGMEVPPKGKYFFGAVTVGERGQIVIPKKAREVFLIEPGDQLLLFGDEDRGIGIIPKRTIHELLKIVGSNLFGAEEERGAEGNPKDSTEEDDSND